MIETAVLATWITFALTAIRKALPHAKSVWREAKWYEKLALCLLFVPIPGPVDEIVALLAVRRILARRRPATAAE